MIYETINIPHIVRRLSLLLLVLVSLSAKAQQEESVSSGFTPAVKTNLLYDAALVPNLGVEIPVARRWTVGIDGFWAWWSKDRRHRYWQGYGAYVTLRHYFGSHKRQNTGNENSQFSILVVTMYSSSDVLILTQMNSIMILELV